MVAVLEIERLHANDFLKHGIDTTFLNLNISVHADTIKVNLFSSTTLRLFHFK